MNEVWYGYTRQCHGTLTPNGLLSLETTRMSRRTLGGISQASKIHTACSHLSVKVSSRAMVTKVWEDGGGGEDGESYAVEWRSNPNDLRHRGTMHE